MHFGISRHDTRMRHRCRCAGEIGDDTACLAHEQDPGGHVPRRKYQLPEPVVAPASDVGEVERRRSGPPHARGRAHGGAETTQIVVDLITMLEWKSGTDERFDRLSDSR